MKELISFALLAITSFFTIINPLAVMPVFMTMTSKMQEEDIRKTAKKAVKVSFVTLIIFAITGQLIFRFFGISVNSLKIVGGVLFFLMGYEMLQARLSAVKVEKEAIADHVRDISITPLAIPMITGPGAITNAIVLMEGTTSLVTKIILILSILLVCFVTYLILVNSSKIHRLLGDTGNIILMRLMGLIVMVIAVEFFFAGLKPILQNILMLQK